MSRLYWALLIIGAPGVFVGCLFMFGRHKEREADIMSRVETEPLPQRVVAYRRIGFLATRAMLSAFCALLFCALTVSELPSFSVAAVIAIPLGVFGFVVFARSVHQVFRDTRLTSWGTPVISLSAETISAKGRWSVPWSQVEEIRFVVVGGRFPNTFMLLNIHDCRRFGRNSWHDTIFLANPGRQPIRQPFLSLELGSTSLPAWEYEIFAKRYWSASRGIAYARDEGPAN